MEAQGHQFTKKALAALIIPLIFESLLNIMIGMADTIMVSNCGESAISAVSLADSISILIVQLFTSFATGGAVVVSQYIGSGSMDKARTSAKNLIYLSGGIAILIVAVMLPLHDKAISLFFGSIDDDVRSACSDYFIPVLVSYPFLAMYSALTAVSRSEEKSGRTLSVSVLMNAMNIIGNAILIFGFGMGTRGAGIASLLSRIAGFLLMFLLMRRKSEELRLTGITKGPVSPKIMWKIMRIGVPTGIEGTLFNVGKILVQSLIAGLGTSAIAVNAIVFNFNAYSNIAGNGINLAMITIIGQCRGRDNISDIRYYTKLMLSLSYLCTILIVLPTYIFMPSIIRIYGIDETSMAIAIPICRSCLIACATLWPMAFSMPNVLKATGDILFIMTISISSMWVFRVGLSHILIRCFGFGVDGVWYAMYADWAFRGIMYISRYRSGKWKDKKVI